MGAMTFNTIVTGKTPREAFRKAVDSALYESGHGGYTGTIAEKHEWINIHLPEGKDPYEFSGELINNDDGRISDKWGPAGCLDITKTSYGIDAGRRENENAYLFFGWASS